MWISRKRYKSLIELIAKKYTEEFNIYKTREEMESVIKERDELKKRVLELEKQRMTIRDIIKWLTGEKYATVDENSDTMTEEYEKEHKWELSRNCYINKTIKYLETYLDDDV